MAEDYSTSYSMDAVREAFNGQEAAKRKSMNASSMPYTESWPYRYIKEVWTDFVLVCDESGSKYNGLVKVPYTVDSKGQVDFGAEIPVRAEYVEMSGSPLWVSPHGPAVLKLSARLEKNV